jgi:aspartate/glutamate racemase
LILREGTASGVPLLDTTQIHAKALVARAWS